jgi:hypothetical protein
MAPIAISFLAFPLALVGILLGSALQRMLPEGHLSSDSKEVVKLSMGGASNTGRSCAWAASREREEVPMTHARVKSIRSRAYVILIDNLLAKYGEEAQPALAPPRKQSQQSSIESGWAKRSISGFRTFNQATRSNADLRTG